MPVKKAIIFYPHIEEYGGIERNIIGLGNKIKQKGFSPVLLCFYDHINMNQYCKDLEVVQMGDHWNPLRKSLRLKNWLNKNSKDIEGLPLFFSGKAGFYAAVHQTKPYPYALHFTDPLSLLKGEKQRKGIKKIILWPKRRISCWLMSQGVKRATLRLTMTQWNASELETDFKYHFDVIYQGGVPPKEEPQAFPRCTGTTLRLFSICRLTYSKNLEWILQTCKYLLNTEPFSLWYKQIEVVIAGKGPQLNKLNILAEKLGISENVKFPGFLTAARVEEEYKKADIFLVSARQGFGLPILEALYRKVPVIINRESRVSEILESNPWVEISENDMEAFIQKTALHITNLRDNLPDMQRLEKLPTEDNWANHIGRHCAWW